MLTFSDSNLKTSPYHYPHKLVLFSSRYTVSCIYCDFFNLSCFGRPSVFDLQIKKCFSGFAGFNIDDITRFFTLAGNVLQHIWQSFSLSAPSPNRFYDTLHFPGFFLSRYPSFIHTSLPSSLTLLLWQRCPGPFLLTSSTALHTDRTKGLSLHQSGYLCADAPSKRWWSWSQCNIKRAWEGKLLNQILTIWPLGSEWFCYWALGFHPFIFLQVARLDGKL